jgi:acyl carrier protein phosphodiesterase
VKGPLATQALHPRVVQGVRRHRRVDVLTDRHAVYRSLREYFPGTSRRYAGIFLDVLFDYYLTCYWSHFCRIPRDEFIEGVYRTLSDYRDILPADFAPRASAWVAADWLRVYETLEGVEAVLQRVSLRARGELPVRQAMAVIRGSDSALQEGFLLVFAAVQDCVNGRNPFLPPVP